MKSLFLLLLVGTLAYSLRAETSFKDLQSLTNTIAIMQHRTVVYDLLLHHREVLKAAEKGGTNAPSADVVADSIDFTNAFFETDAFYKRPPAEIVPKLFNLLENDEICDRWQVSMNGQYTNTYSQLVYSLISGRLKIYTQFQDQKGQATMLWVPERENYVGRPVEFPFFWYYAGLKHLPTLWDDWYTIWKLENQRDVPRTNILERLSRQISRQFSYHLFPFVAKAIEDGDKTLEPLIDKLPKTHNYRLLLWGSFRSTIDPAPELFEAHNLFFTNATTFVSWWKDNKEKYIITLPKRTLADFKHVIRRKCRPSWIGETTYRAALRAEKALDAYGAQKEHPISNCWYFAIKDEDGNQSE